MWYIYLPNHFLQSPAICAGLRREALYLLTWCQLGLRSAEAEGSSLTRWWLMLGITRDGAGPQTRGYLASSHHEVCVPRVSKQAKQEPMGSHVSFPNPALEVTQSHVPCFLFLEIITNSAQFQGKGKKSPSLDAGVMRFWREWETGNISTANFWKTEFENLLIHVDYYLIFKNGPYQLKQI